MTTNHIKTKRGNRNFTGERPKHMSRSRYGLLINYWDWKAIHPESPMNLSRDVLSVKDLYYQFYEPLRNYGTFGGFGSGSYGPYMRKKEVLINPVGELRAYRYYLTEYGKKRLEFLRAERKKRMKKLGRLKK